MRILTLFFALIVCSNCIGQVAKIAAANLALNMGNSLLTSKSAGNFTEDSYINANKIVTGYLGSVMGIPGTNIFTNTILPSIYSNGTDAYINSQNK